MKIELHIFSTEMPREICTCQQSLVDIALMLEEVLLVQLPIGRQLCTLDQWNISDTDVIHNKPWHKR